MQFAVASTGERERETCDSLVVRLPLLRRAALLWPHLLIDKLKPEDPAGAENDAVDLHHLLAVIEHHPVFCDALQPSLDPYRSVAQLLQQIVLRVVERLRRVCLSNSKGWL